MKFHRLILLLVVSTSCSFAASSLSLLDDRRSNHIRGNTRNNPLDEVDHHERTSFPPMPFAFMDDDLFSFSSVTGSFSESRARQTSSVTPLEFSGFLFSDAGFDNNYVGGSSGSVSSDAFGQSVYEIEFRLDTPHSYVLDALAPPFHEPCCGLLHLRSTNGVEVFRFDSVGIVSEQGMLEPGRYIFTASSTREVAGGSNGETSFELSHTFDFSLQFTEIPVIEPPLLSIRFSEVEICWESRSNLTYQVQYQSDLTSNQWADLGPVLVGSGSTNCFVDKILVSDPKRFYRVRVVQ